MAKRKRDRHPEPTPNFAQFPLTSLNARLDSFPSLAYQGEEAIELELCPAKSAGLADHPLILAMRLLFSLHGNASFA
jgi:hypothetical protein